MIVISGESFLLNFAGDTDNKQTALLPARSFVGPYVIMRDSRVKRCALFDSLTNNLVLSGGKKVFILHSTVSSFSSYVAPIGNRKEKKKNFLMNMNMFNQTTCKYRLTVSCFWL